MYLSVLLGVLCVYEVELFFLKFSEICHHTSLLFFIISSQGYFFFLISGSWVQWLKLTKEIALQILWFFDCAQKFTGEGLPNELPCQQLKFEAGEKGCLISLGFLQASLLTLLSTHSLEMGVISKTSIVFSMWKSFSAGLLGLPGFCSRPCTNGRSHM